MFALVLYWSWTSSIFTPDAARVYVVRPEDRTLAIGGENRVLVVNPEDRNT
jgi:hypothetical protein